MAKKKKKTRAKTKPSEQKASVSRKPSIYPLLLLVLGAVVLAVGGFYYYQGNRSQSNPAPQTVQTAQARSGLLETRPTLPSTMFSGKVRDAYAIAEEIPQVLDQLYCYCRCRENFGHKNLLSCYVDNHAST